MLLCTALLLQATVVLWGLLSQGAASPSAELLVFARPQAHTPAAIGSSTHCQQRGGSIGIPGIDVELVVPASTKGGGSIARVRGVLDTGLSMPLLFPGSSDATSCTVVGDLVHDAHRALSPCVSDRTDNHDDASYGLAVRRLRLHASRRKTLHMADGGAVRGVLVDAAVAHVALFLSGVAIGTTFDPLSAPPTTDALPSINRSTTTTRRVPLHHLMVVETVNAVFAASVLQHVPRDCRILVGCSPVAQHTWRLSSKGRLPNSFVLAARLQPMRGNQVRTLGGCSLSDSDATEHRLSRLRYRSAARGDRNQTRGPPASKLRFSATVPSLVKVHAARLERISIVDVGDAAQRPPTIRLLADAASTERQRHLTVGGGVVILDSASPVVAITSPPLMRATMEALCSIIATQCGGEEGSSHDRMLHACSTSGVVDGAWLPTRQQPNGGRGVGSTDAAMRKQPCNGALAATMLVFTLSGPHNGSAAIDVRVPLADLISDVVGDGSGGGDVHGGAHGEPHALLLLHGHGLASTLSGDPAEVHVASRVAVILGAPLLRSNDVVLSVDGAIGFFEPMLLGDATDREARDAALRSRRGLERQPPDVVDAHYAVCVVVAVLLLLGGVANRRHAMRGRAACARGAPSRGAQGP